ncbi:2650_t:CDS:10 [Cetraspora pellucida]|uniref:Large ribosomal subunit protein bL31c n=1 Tax=Cetraspora pellucida TaxID=1433469 RepID=A0A9N9A1U7_9GLOM|nr:2650_t:CDS:10 [Cetraspora pellucida]
MELVLQFLPADKKKEVYQKLKESYKDTLTIMKKGIHLPIQQIIITCLGCNQQYQTVSTVTNEIKIDSCHKNYPRNVSEEKFASARIEEPDRTIDEFATRYQKKFKLLSTKDEPNDEARYMFLTPEDAEFLSSLEMEYSRMDFGNAFLSRAAPTSNSHRAMLVRLYECWEQDEFFMGKLVLEKKVLTRLKNNKDYSSREKRKVGERRLEEEEINEYPGLEGDLNLREFTKLEEVHLPGFRLTGLLLSDSVYGELENLTTINCQKNRLQSLNLDFCPSLKTLKCSDNNLTSLDLKNNQKLISLDCSNNSINQLIFPSNSFLATKLSGKNQSPQENDFSGLLASFEGCGNLELMVAEQLAKVSRETDGEKEAREAAEKKVKELEIQIEKGIEELAAHKIAERERKIANLETKNQNLTKDLNSQEEKINSLRVKLVEQESNASSAAKTTQEKEVIKQKEIENLETEIKKLRQEIIDLKKKEKEETVEKVIEKLVEVEDAKVQTEQSEPKNPVSPTTTSQLSPYSDGSSMLNPSSNIDFSTEEDKITTALIKKLSELTEIGLRGIEKEKEVMELRRKLFQIERAKINKRCEEKTHKNEVLASEGSNPSSRTKIIANEEDFSPAEERKENIIIISTTPPPSRQFITVNQLSFSNLPVPICGLANQTLFSGLYLLRGCSLANEVSREETRNKSLGIKSSQFLSGSYNKKEKPERP